MTALTGPRRPLPRYGDSSPNNLFAGALAAGVKLWSGAVACFNAAGYVVPGQTAVGLRTAGVVEKTYDNTLGVNGAVKCEIRAGIFPMNILAGDPVAQADIGNTCYLVDDNTIAKTNGSSTRSAAGVIEGFTDDGTQALVRLSL